MEYHMGFVGLCWVRLSSRKRSVSQVVRKLNSAEIEQIDRYPQSDLL